MEYMVLTAGCSTLSDECQDDDVWPREFAHSCKDVGLQGDVRADRARNGTTNTQSDENVDHHDVPTATVHVARPAGGKGEAQQWQTLEHHGVDAIGSHKQNQVGVLGSVCPRTVADAVGVNRGSEVLPRVEEDSSSVAVVPPVAIDLCTNV